MAARALRALPVELARSSIPRGARGTIMPIRRLSATPIRAGGHGPEYDEPGGWLFGIPPDQKYQKEGWENTWHYGFWGSLILGVIAYAYKPDTS